MHDIRLIRDDPDAFDAALARRGAPSAAEAMLALDRRRRDVSTRMQDAQGRRNEASKAIGKAMGQGDTATADTLKAEIAELKRTLPESGSAGPRAGGRSAGHAFGVAQHPRARCSRWGGRQCQCRRSRVGAQRRHSPSIRANMPISARRWEWISKPARRFRARALPFCAATWPGCIARSGNSCSTVRRAPTATPNAIRRCW